MILPLLVLLGAMPVGLWVTGDGSLAADANAAEGSGQVQKGLVAQRRNRHVVQCQIQHAL